MKECVLITSIIDISDYPLTYTPTRSIYSHEERYIQTLETIESVRKYFPEADICLVECSPDSDRIRKIETYVDKFVNLYPNDTIRNTKNKGIGECLVILGAIDTFDLKQYDAVFKITGRYVLQSSFDKSAWESGSVVARIGEHYMGDNSCIHTFFYKISSSSIDVWKAALHEFIIGDKGECIEKYISERLRPTYVNHIGILVRWSSYPSTPIF